MATAPLPPRTSQLIRIAPVISTDAALQSQLLSIWDASVRKTHDFLSEAAISALKPLVRQGICQVPHLFVASGENAVILAFMGVAEDKIEMLFVDPPFIGKGIGKALVFHAIAEHGICRVDVNEQNPKALGFYQHCGFQVTGRSARDDQGNPYPILHLTTGEV